MISLCDHRFMAAQVENFYLMNVCALSIVVVCLSAVIKIPAASLTNIPSFKPFVGLCYSPFNGSQSPNYGTYATISQITFDLTNSVTFLASETRTFGMDNTLSNIAGICNSYNIKCFPCAYLGTDTNDNAYELNALIMVANNNYPTTRGLIVGTEALRAGYDPQMLVSNINYVRAATHTNIPIGTADVPASLLAAPAVVAVCDFVMINPYAYWAQQPIANAARWTIQQWQSFTNAYPGKRVIIGEVNWPTGGTNAFWSNYAVVPSVGNQSKFLSDFVSMATSNKIEYFIFEYRDEPWKDQEGVGTVEQNWGITTTNNVKKQSLANYLSTNFTMRMVSAKTNTLTLSVQTYEKNPYSLVSTTNLLGGFGNQVTNFIAAAGTNQTFVVVTNNTRQKANFFRTVQNF